MARPPQTVSNIVKSTLVVIVGVALIVLATVTKRSDEPGIEYRATWSAAQRESSISPLAPENLPDGWKAISVNFTKTSWHLGVMTVQGRYIGIEQGDGYLEWIKGAKAAGQWQGWDRWSSPKWRALSDSRVVLCGDASFAELEVLATRLRG